MENAWRQIWRDVSNFALLDEKFRADKGMALYVLSKSPELIGCVTVSLKGDFDIVMCVIKANGLYIKEASLALRDNREILLTAIKNNPQSLKYGSFRLKNDKQFAIDVLSNNMSLLDFFSNEIKCICGKGKPQKQISRLMNALNSESLFNKMNLNLKINKIEKQIKI